MERALVAHHYRIPPAEVRRWPMVEFLRAVHMLTGADG